jgi:hypothetical protein
MALLLMIGGAEVVTSARLDPGLLKYFIYRLPFAKLISSVLATYVICLSISLYGGHGSGFEYRRVPVQLLAQGEVFDYTGQTIVFTPRNKGYDACSKSVPRCFVPYKVLF